MLILIIMDNNRKGRVNVDMIVTYLVKQGQGRMEAAEVEPLPRSAKDIKMT